MAEISTFIKLDRNILNWQWYQNANTFRVFLHLLLKANVKNGKFQGVEVKRGELISSYESLASQLDLTISQVRTAISHLKLTGEIAITRHSKFLVFTIVNYAQYQDKPTKLAGKSTIKSQSNDNQIAITSQQSKNIKNNKNIKNIYSAKKSSYDSDLFKAKAQEPIEYKRKDC